MNDKHINRSEAILIVGLLICTLALCSYRLEVYPAPWFDEGLSLQVSKNLLLHGKYGMLSLPEGLREFDPAIQAGPTILLPVTLAFRVAGTGILQARLVIVLYTILAIPAFYWLVREVCGRKVAFLASLLLIFTFDHEFTSFVFMGRQLLAEVPALAFFWLGTLFWFRAWKSPRWPALVCPGLLWGLAMLTKVQFVLMLTAALILFWLFDRISSQKLQIRHVLVPVLVSGGCMLTWYGYQALTMGCTDFWQQTMELGSAGGMHLLHFSPQRTMSAIFQLLGSSVILFGLPGMLYTVGSSLRNGEETEYQQVFLVAFAAVWLGWYAFLSIGWMRYAFVPAAMSTIFSARLLGDLWDWAGQPRQSLGRRLPLAPGHAAIGGMIVMLLLSGLIPMVKQIVQSPDSGLQELARHLNTHIPTDVVIESWEWEVAALTGHTYHHPPYEVTNAFTERIWYGSPVPDDIYDPLTFHSTYLIVGPFAKWTGVYSQHLLEHECTRVESIGEYDLYKVNTDGEN